MSQNFQPGQTSHLNKDEIIQAINDMSPEDKQAVVEKASAGLRPPDRKTSDTLWLIIIYSFAIVLVGTFVSLAIGVLVLGKSAANSELQILLTMFTGVVAFLAGLLTQGPTRTGQPPA